LSAFSRVNKLFEENANFRNNREVYNSKNPFRFRTTIGLFDVTFP